MKKSQFSEGQIAMALRQMDAGSRIPEVTRALGISETTYSVWRKNYGQMAVAEIRRLRQLETSSCGDGCAGWPKPSPLRSSPTARDAANRGLED